MCILEKKSNLKQYFAVFHLTHANLYFHWWHKIQAKESKTLIYNIMTVPSIMTILMKIITIIIVIVFHDDDFDENHHDHHCDCLSKLSVLGPFECLLGRVGGTPWGSTLVKNITSWFWIRVQIKTLVKNITS